jgi:glycosyltransferase involved in cell wall biosynthesis
MKIAVAIPCYKTKDFILKVIEKIGNEVSKIYVIDDKCTEGTGKYVVDNNKDPRVEVIFNEVNMGVGGAVKEGFKRALEDNMDIVVKIDGDSQMDPTLIPKFVKPIIDGKADYVKGNRFYSLDYLQKMPSMRLFGNSFLSFINKMVSGYWNIMDPTNGYVAISTKAIKLLPLNKIANRYFFESDMLFRLNIVRACIKEVPMKALYQNEKSSLRIGKILLSFPSMYLKRFVKRIFYNYFLRDFNIGSVEIVFGTCFFLFGLIFGIYKWYQSIHFQNPSTSGTVMLAALPIIIGIQFLLAAVQYDISNVPKEPLEDE